MADEAPCHCGLPLHYQDPGVRRHVERLVARLGTHVRVRVGEAVYLVQRHYIALHGLKGAEVERLGFEVADDE